MIIDEFQLSGYQSARCWVDELPDLARLKNVTRTVRHDSDLFTPVQSRQAALEWLVPRGNLMYGLLGGEVRSADNGFTINIASTTKPLAPFNGAMVSGASDEVRGGLLEEYEQAVVDGMNEAIDQWEMLPSATVTCDLAACGMVGSSDVIFRALGRSLINLLIMREAPNKDAIEAILVFE